MPEEYKEKRTEEDMERDFVVADMTGVERPGLFKVHKMGTWKNAGGRSGAGAAGPAAGAEASSADMTYAKDPAPSQEPIVLTKEERKWYILGAVKAALIVGFVFAGGLTLVVLLMYLFLPH